MTHLSLRGLVAPFERLQVLPSLCRSSRSIAAQASRSQLPRCSSTSTGKNTSYMSTPRPRPKSMTAPASNKPAGPVAEAEFLPLPRSLSPSKALLLLLLPIPPEHWPSHLDLYSTLYRRASKELKEAGISVNCIYDGSSTQTSFDPGSTGEMYPAKLYGPCGIKRYDEFTVDSIERVKHDLSAVSAVGSSSSISDEVVEIMVCTHGSRDCRCSDHGGALVASLRSEIRKRGLEGRMSVGEIAHVGGHKYAANAIVLPSIDMYSNLRHADASDMIDHLLSTLSPLRDPDPATSSQMREYDTPSPFWDHWRGKYGSSESDQAAIWARIDPSPKVPTWTSRSLAVDAVSSGKRLGGLLTFRTWEGDRRPVEVKVGETLLEVARREDLPSMEGTCGGNLECSTCHLYIDASAPIPEAEDEELDMLDYALGFREGESRLGCQIKVDEKLLEWSRGGGELKLPRY